MVRQIQGGHFLFCCHRNFNYPVKPILKDFVYFFDVFESETVSNKRGCEIISIRHHNGQLRAGLSVQGNP